MFWVIILLIIGGIGLAGYRYYAHPPLASAKQQRETYLQRFRYGKKLIYHGAESQFTQLGALLKTTYLSAGNGCFYGNGAMIYLHTDINAHQINIHLFGRTSDILSRTTYKIIQLKKQTSGGSPTAAHG